MFLVANFGFSLSVIANSSKGTFYEQCQRWLPAADRFASDCLVYARAYNRVFYPSGGFRGESEKFFVYFNPENIESRFHLGCVLSSARKLSFVGIYYSHEPVFSANLNKDPISFVDFNANVGIKLNGKQLTILAVRQFKSELIPEKTHGYRYNCEAQDMEFGRGSDPANPYARAYRYLEGDVMQPVDRNGKGETSGIKLKRYFGPHEYPLIYGDFEGSTFIDANGILMLREMNSKYDPCINQKQDTPNVSNIMYEMCRK